jgi:hypothetical protein
MLDRFNQFTTYVRNGLTRRWHRITVDRREVPFLAPVVNNLQLPDLRPLEQAVQNPPERSGGMAGHVLFLYNLTRQLKAQTVVEIGLGSAESTCSFLTALKETGGKLISIDIERKPYAEEKIKQINGLDQWVFVQQPSEQAYKTWPHGTIDILLIDGLHTYHQIKIEYHGYLPLMRPGGYILFHDSETIVGVRKFVKELGGRGVQFPFSNGMYVLRVP